MSKKKHPQDEPHEILRPIIFRGEGELNGQILRPSGNPEKPTVAPSFSHIQDPLDYEILVKARFIKPIGGK